MEQGNFDQDEGKCFQRKILQGFLYVALSNFKMKLKCNRSLRCSISVNQQGRRNRGAIVAMAPPLFSKLCKSAPFEAKNGHGNVPF